MLSNHIIMTIPKRIQMFRLFCGCTNKNEESYKQKIEMRNAGLVSFMSLLEIYTYI